MPAENAGQLEILPDDKKSKRMAKRDLIRSVEFFTDMIHDMEAEYGKYKGRKYPWLAWHKVILAEQAQRFQAHGIAAMWAVFMDPNQPSAKFADRTGYSIKEFLRQMPSLMDSPSWKILSKSIEQQFLRANGARDITANVVDLLGDRQKTGTFSGPSNPKKTTTLPIQLKEAAQTSS